MRYFIYYMHDSGINSYTISVLFLQKNHSKTIQSRNDLRRKQRKMSKSRGNVVNPDDVVETYGADTLRMYEMFMGPLDASIAWSENGLGKPNSWIVYGV